MPQPAGIKVIMMTSNSILEKYLNLSKNVEGFFNSKHAVIWDMLYSMQKDIDAEGNQMEIGVLHGKSVIMSILQVRNESEKVYLVDLERRSSLEKNLKLLSEKERSHCEYLIGDSKIIFKAEFVEKKKNTFRWIHIDGEHTFDGAFADIVNANSLLNEKGIICVDDFFNPRYPQITDAIFQFVYSNSNSLSFFAIGNNKGYLCRPGLNRHYFGTMVSDFESKLEEGNDDMLFFRGMINGHRCLGLR